MYNLKPSGSNKPEAYVQQFIFILNITVWENGFGSVCSLNMTSHLFIFLQKQDFRQINIYIYTVMAKNISNLGKYDQRRL